MLQTRHSFARLVPVMGESILSKIPPLIGGLLRQSTTGELIDFLPFLGQLIHKFKVGPSWFRLISKPNIRDFLDELMLPLLSKIFESLNKPVEGTDDVVEQTSMRKAYLSFILNLLNNRMESIFVSEGNFEITRAYNQSTAQNSKLFSKALCSMRRIPQMSVSRKLLSVC